jgi:hypothetical protein
VQIANTWPDGPDLTGEVRTQGEGKRLRQDAPPALIQASHGPTPAARTLTRTSPGPGSGLGARSSLIVSGGQTNIDVSTCSGASPWKVLFVVIVRPSHGCGERLCWAGAAVGYDWMLAAPPVARLYAARVWRCYFGSGLVSELSWESTMKTASRLAGSVALAFSLIL